MDYVSEHYHIADNKLKDFISKTDKKRASYYNYYTNKKWGAASSYDLCINTSTVGYEGAIEMINGKAKLTREDYCDGLGDCLPACPTGAITFEERETPAYNEAAVIAAKNKNATLPCGCPGTQSKAIHRNNNSPEGFSQPISSQLSQWPVQIKLVPINAPYFNGAKLLVAADCTAFAYGNFHNEFIKNHVTLIGCPKLDNINYAEKLGLKNGFTQDFGTAKESFIPPFDNTGI